MNNIPYFSSEGITYLTSNELYDMFNVNDDVDKLYHFTDFDSFLKIWLSKKLLFSKRDRMNDVAEKYDMIVGDDIVKMQAYLYAVCEYKQISLSKRVAYNGIEIFKSPLMWGFYAKNATGVCIEFDKEKLISRMSGMYYDEIQYLNKIPNNSLLSECEINSIQSIDDARVIVDENIDKIFFEKSSEWQFEAEFRIISRVKDYLDISDCVTCVYLFDADLSIKKIVYNLIESKLNIKIVYISSILKKERYLDMFSLQERLLKKSSYSMGDFEYWLKNDQKKNFK